MSGSMSIGMNVFRQEPFSAVALTNQVNNNPYVPGFLGQFGEQLFEPLPIPTESVEIDVLNGVLTLIPTSARGAPPKQRVNTARNARLFKAPRLAHADTIYASQVQSVRAYNEGEMLQTVAKEVQRRLTGPDGLTKNIELTWEYHRLGAIQGVLLDSNGAVIYNWFNEFAIAPPTPIAFNLTVTEPVGSPAVLPTKFNNVVRQMARASKGSFVEGYTEVHALAGDSFFDALVSHPDARAMYLATVSAPRLGDNSAFGTFYYGGVYWHNYRGTDDMTTVAVPTNTCIFFPIKAPGVFKWVQAPGERISEVNTLGKPMYINPDVDPRDNPAFIDLEITSYPLHICTKPGMLLTGTM